MSRLDSAIGDIKGKNYPAVGTHSWKGCHQYPTMILTTATKA